MGGLDGVWAAVLPATDWPYSHPFSLTGWGTTWPHHFHSLMTVFIFNINPATTQICTCHQLLHPQVLHLLIKLFETEHSQLDVMEQVGFLSYSSALSVSRSIGVMNLYNPPSAHAVLVFLSRKAGAEEDPAGPNGSPSEPWIRAASRRLHSQMSGETQHRYLPH